MLHLKRVKQLSSCPENKMELQYVLFASLILFIIMFFIFYSRKTLLKPVKKCEMCNGDGYKYEYHGITSLITCEYCDGTGIANPNKVPCDLWNEDEECSYEIGLYCSSKPCVDDLCGAINTSNSNE